MQTYSHFILTKAFERLGRLNRLDPAGNLPPAAGRDLLIGSIAPDFPLIALTAVFLGYDAGRWLRFGVRADVPATRTLFDTLFFQARWVQAIHNVLHAPLILLSLMLWGYWGWRRAAQWGSRLFWFAAACLVHTAIDIPLHHDDGPLLLFPFDWERRFVSPVSYWDPARYGRPFFIAEHLLIGLVTGWLVRDWWRQR